MTPPFMLLALVFIKLLLELIGLPGVHVHFDSAHLLAVLGEVKEPQRVTGKCRPTFGRLDFAKDFRYGGVAFWITDDRLPNVYLA